MTATILSENNIPGLPSASGVEVIGPVAYVIGDDTPFLYLLDAATLAVLAQVRLFETQDFDTGRIPKSLKPDLEAMTALTWPDGRAGVLVLGSGSTSVREKGWFVPVSGSAPQLVDLSPLYTALRGHLPAGIAFNLEATATTDTELLLFQRTVGRADVALIFALPLAQAVRFLAGEANVALPEPRRRAFQLPEIDGCAAGFSGATFVNGHLFVSASVENTTNAVLDGEVLGSFIGVVDLSTGKAAFARLAWADGRAYRGKVEGLAVRQQLAANQFDILLVTDDDAGGSTAVVAKITLE